MIAHKRKRLRLRGFVGCGLQVELPPAEIDPATELVTYLRKYRDATESSRVMQPHARFIRQRDTGARLHITLNLEDCKQTLVQCPADPFLSLSRADVYGNFDSPSVRCPLAKLAGVS